MDVIAVSLRRDFTDMVQVDNVAVVAAEKNVAGEFFQNIRYFSAFTYDFIFIVEDQMPVVRFDKPASGVNKAKMSFAGRKPEGGTVHGDFQSGIVIPDCAFEMLDQFPAFRLGNFADNNMYFVHNGVPLFCKFSL